MSDDLLGSSLRIRRNDRSCQGRRGRPGGVARSRTLPYPRSSGRTRTYAIPSGWTEDRITNGPPGYRTLDLTTLDPQPGFLSIATATEAPGFDPRAVTRLAATLGSSGALDDLCWDPRPDS